MSAGNTVNITAHTINNTVVGADGQPVHAVIGLGQNTGAQAVGGGGASAVGGAQGAHGSVAQVDLGTAPGTAAGGAVDLPGSPLRRQCRRREPVSPQVVGTLGGSHPTASLPQSGLYTVLANPGSPYLVETDPRFTQYSQFISSDYMMGQLGIDPAGIRKRLGDGFYEQRTVLDQITRSPAVVSSTTTPMRCRNTAH